jgi:hypothetical protein
MKLFCSRWLGKLGKMGFNENDDNPDVDPGGNDLHHFLRSGEAELQEDAQELPNERQKGMQLRQRLRLLIRNLGCFLPSKIEGYGHFSRTILPIVYPE